MKKTLLTIFIATQLITQLFAGGDISECNVQETQIGEDETESKFYIIAKGLMILGDTVNHESAILTGDRGYGFGIDLGYRLGNGFALEYDFSYADNTVSEEADRSAEATYYTSALDLVYTYQATKNLGIFVKTGYEYEWENIAEFAIDGTDHGLVFGGGVEVAINDEYRFVAEYEHSTIEGPHGNSIFAGVMYNF